METVRFEEMGLSEEIQKAVRNSIEEMHKKM